MIGDKTYLRALEYKDLDKLNEWHNDELIFPYITANKYFISKARDEKWIRHVMLNDSNNLYLAICFKETDEMIGYTSLLDIDYRNSKAIVGGWTMDRTYQRRQIGVDAWLQYLSMAFNDFGLNRLVTAYLESNIVTARHMKTHGFKVESILREEVYKAGKYHNVVVVSILSSEYKEKEKYDLDNPFIK
ncbi:MAG: GNAT family protein [Bacteroidales bacterium]